MYKKTKIFIGIPCYNGFISHLTFKGLTQLFKWLDFNQIEWKYYLLTTDSLVSRARNTIVTKFLDEADYTHLFFVDADIGFEVSNFQRILDYDNDLVCGIYPQKKLFWNAEPTFNNGKINPESLLRYNVNFLDSSNIYVDQKGFTKVKEIATGFMLVKRNVFEKLIQNYKEIKFKARFGAASENSENNYDFFKVGNYKEKNGNTVYLSEDFYFSRLWLDCGGEIYADVHSSLKHMGSYVYEGSLSSVMKKKE